MKDTSTLVPCASFNAVTMSSALTLVTERPKMHSPSESADAHAIWMPRLAAASSAVVLSLQSNTGRLPAV